MNTIEANAARLGDIPSLVSFGDGLASQDRVDIQDMLLDAQLYASHVNDFERQWTTWMHYYRFRLGSRGLTRKSVVMDDSLLVTSPEDLLQATFRITGTAGREQLGDLVRRSFSGLGVYEAAEAYLRNGTGQTRLGSFQVVSCPNNETNQQLLLLCGLHLSADEHSSSGRRLLFYFKGGSYLFSSDSYNAYRDDVRRYLKTKANAFIRGVHI